MQDKKPEGVQISGIVERIKSRYKIELADTGQEDNLKSKIESVCKRIPVKTTDQNGDIIVTNLWEARMHSQGKKNAHYFTEEDIEQVINSPELHRYIKTKLCDQEESEKYKEHEKTAKTWNGKYLEDPGYLVDYMIEMRDQGHPDGVDPNLVPYDIARKKALEIMLEALFLRYFEPIDIENLRKDMEIRSAMDDAEGEYTAEMAEVYSRLKNPVEAYCTPREPDKKN